MIPAPSAGSGPTHPGPTRPTTPPPPPPSPKSGVRQEMPGTAEIARAINESLARRAQ